MGEGYFDVVIIGTGLTESICAAALSKAGFKVAHIDENPYYGGDEASLSLDELILWADTRSSGDDPCFTSISRSSESLPYSRQYSICLCPTIIPSVGPLISSLVASGVAKYGGFRLLEHVGIYHSPGIVKTVPGSKEDVFKNKDITLPDKRRLMRFLMFAVGTFEDSTELQGKNDLPFSDFLRTVFTLNDEMALTIVYSLAHCVDPSDRTRPALERTRRYLRSTGRYGPSPFLVGHYGGAGDISQGFCRAAAVSGGVYILGRRVLSISNSPTPNEPEHNPTSKREDMYHIRLDDFPEPIYCNLILSSSSYSPRFITATNRTLTPQQHIARCVAITDRPIIVDHAIPWSPTAEGADPGTQAERQMPDTNFLVYPPCSLPGGSDSAAATVLITGEGTLSAPTGRWIIYVSLPLVSKESAPAETLLKPYLDATMKLSIPSSSSTTLPNLLFTLFYVHHSPGGAASQANLGSLSKDGRYLACPPTPLYPLPEVMDAATTNAETMFWKIVETIKPESRAGGGNETILQDFWPPQIDPQARNEDEDDEW